MVATISAIKMLSIDKYYTLYEASEIWGKVVLAEGAVRELNVEVPAANGDDVHPALVLRKVVPDVLTVSELKEETLGRLQTKFHSDARRAPPGRTYVVR